MNCYAYHLHVEVVNLSKENVILVDEKKSESYMLGVNKKVMLQVNDSIFINNNKIKFSSKLTACSWTKVMGLLYSTGIITTVFLNDKNLGQICATINNLIGDSYYLLMEINENRIVKIKILNRYIVRVYYNNDIEFSL